MVGTREENRENGAPPVTHDNTSNSNKNGNAKSKGSTALMQIFMSLGPLVLTLGVGAMTGYSAVFLPQFKKENESNGEADLDIESWIASAAVLPMPFACLLGGLLMQLVGRKRSHLIGSIPGILGWVTIYFAPNTAVILIGRVLTGLSCGLYGPVTAVYIGEMTSPSLRPFLLGCIALNLSLGTLYCQLIGTYCHWKLTALLCSVFPIFGAILTLFCKESPAWFLSKDKVEEACAVFNAIREDSEDNTKELNVMLEGHKLAMSEEKKSFCDKICSLVPRPEVYKPCITLVLYFVSAQLAGINVISFYTINIVKMSLDPEFTEEYLVMIAMDVIRVLTSILACVLITKLKRRHIAIIGGIGTFFSLLALSASGYKPELFPNYIPIVALLFYIFFITISLVPLPWCLAGELLPMEVKNIASGTICAIVFLSYFVVVKLFPFAFSVLGPYITYLIFAGSALFGTTLCFFFLPETKNKTLDDITEGYKGKKQST